MLRRRLLISGIATTDIVASGFNPMYKSEKVSIYKFNICIKFALYDAPIGI
jgi:hypothetical protein